MAIVFIKDLDTDKLTLARNNNVVEYYIDDASPAVKSTITIGTNTITLYPSPTGIFYFNFKELISTLINVDNFKDDLNIDFDNTFVYDWTGKINLNETITFEVEKADDTTVTANRLIDWLDGYVNLRNWKRSYPADNLLVDDIALLQKKSTDSYFDYRVKYWEGFPFDITLWLKPYVLDNFQITNKTNGIPFEYTNEYKIARFAFSDGRTDLSIEDFVPFQTGFNDLQFEDKFNLQVNKIENCGNGIYIKWINSLGGWNYWLFANGEETKTTKDSGSLFNDYNNLEDTISPLVSIGKTSQNTIKIQQRKIDEDFKNLFDDLIDSPKVYLFTGVPFSKNTFNDWVEVNLKTGNFRIENPRENLYTFDLTLELPPNITRTV